ncbi:MAG: transcriptional regulator [Spirochaetes bacterium GWF1_41_5]|nr:MAG: transcriptional regulator [Spirochaetes bacterium GWF1_41_5]HBE01896.1 XRE family transcriptional regulator [Spirochaetia bacterium]
MKSFRSHLNEKLKDSKFRQLYEQEKKLVEIALEVKKVREDEGLSQEELARKAHITQQQLSKIENGLNCNITTFLKVMNALHMQMSLIHQKG